MKKININFIPQNIAPVGAKKIAIFDSNGNKVDSLPLGNLSPKNSGTKLYSFGALSDVHLPYAAQQASTDFQKALTYFNNVAKVNFICIAGDISDAGTEAEWLDYKNHVDAYSPNIPVYMCTGNHDTAYDITYEYPIQYTGHPLWYSFTQGDDVFIFFGLRKWQGDDVFYNEALQWLYETLEENKDKRCFVFQHEMRLDGCGNGHGLYGWDGLAGRNGQVFLSLMEHYKNVIWFHGHSHTPFRLQSVQPTPIANYDRLFGCHSVHIPSLAIPRYGNSDVIFDAEGYIVDVYENGIHLRGIDFIEEEFVPIASYWIDTTPVDIPVNSYVDTRGVINKKTISLPEGSELIMNQRYSYSGNGLVTDTVAPFMFTAIMPVMSNTNYVLKIKNSNIEIPSASSSVVYGLDSSKMPAQYINGGNIPSMTTGITLSEDKKSADITFTTNNNVSYIVLSLKAIISGTLKESDIVDYVIELEQTENNEQPIIPEEVLKYTNLIPTSIDTDGTIFNSVGYKNNTYISTTNAELKDYNGFVTTGLINKPDDNTLYIYGAILDTDNSITDYTICRVVGCDSSFNYTSVIPGGSSNSSGNYTVTDMGNGIQKLELISSQLTNAKYIRLSLNGVGENLYVYSKADELISLPKGSELYLNQRYSQSGGGLTDHNGAFALIIPIYYPSINHILTLSNMPNNNLNDQSTTFYKLDVNRTCTGYVNGSQHPCLMGSGCIISEEGRSAVIEFSPSSDTCYMVFTFQVHDTDSITENDLKGIIISLEYEGDFNKGEITNSVLWTANTRISGTDGSYKEQNNCVASNDISVQPGDVIRVYGFTGRGSYPYIAAFTEGVFVHHLSLELVSTSSGNTFDASYDDENNILEVRIKPNTAIDMIRISNYCTNLDVLRVTKNMELSIPREITSEVDWQENTRLSSSNGGYSEQKGIIASNDVIVAPGDIIRFYGFNTLGSYCYVNTYTNGNFATNSPISNAGLNPSETNDIIAEFDVSTNILTVQIKPNASIDIIRVCGSCLNSKAMRVTMNMDVYNTISDEPIVLPEGSELILNQRYSLSGGGMTSSSDADKAMFTVFIPLDHTSRQKYKLSIKNSPIDLTTATGSIIYSLYSDKTNGALVNGGVIPTMTDGATFYNNNRSVDIEFEVSENRKYIVLSLRVTLATGAVITETDLNGYIISIEKQA